MIYFYIKIILEDTLVDTVQVGEEIDFTGLLFTKTNSGSAFAKHSFHALSLQKRNRLSRSHLMKFCSLHSLVYKKKHI